MDHDVFQELLCLRLYGELDAEGDARLDAHLSTCAACRSFALELEGGELARRRPAEPDALPAEWAVRRRALRAHARPPRWIPWLTFAAGLAAGIACAFLLRSPASARPGAAPLQVAELDGQAPFVPRAEPPPPSASRGPLARLGARR